MSKTRRRLDLEAIFGSGALEAPGLKNARWTNDGSRLWYTDRYVGSRHPTIWELDAASLDRRPLLDPRKLRVSPDGPRLTVHSVRPSPDEKCLLLTTEAPARFRPCGDLFVYRLDTGQLARLTSSATAQYHPEFSPDGSRVGFVRGSDIWYVDVQSGVETRVTSDGTDTIYNGRCGWVYEEELGLARSWEWSPDGTGIAFLQQDEANVPEVLLPRYDLPHGDPLRTRYPKAGDPNPSVRLGVADVNRGDVRWMDLTSLKGDPAEEHYIASLQWSPDGREILIQYLPRLQNRLALAAVDAETGACRIVLEETDETWVDPPGKLRFVGESGQFLWLSERDGWRHLYLYDLEGRCVRQLTRGAWEVSDVVGVDSSRCQAFFLAALPRPTDRNLYRVSLEGGEPQPLTHVEGVHSVLMAPGCERMLVTHSTLNTPPVTTIRSVDGSVSQPLTQSVEGKLRARGVPVGQGVSGGWEILTFRTEDGVELYGRMLKPRDFDPERRYPVLMHTYGGPGSQVVLDQWGGAGELWYHYLAERGYLVFLCDNRGTGGRGRDFKKCTYLRLGQLEVEDQIAAARYLASLPWVDPRRIAIWGWSYGGYMTAMLMLRGADVFRAGIAVAPVTDWRLYDTIYTERYMRRPDENPEGYQEGAPVHHARRLRGKLLIIHGTLDDNVHFQNSARLVSALQDAGKQFETLFYPERRHGIEGRRLHLYRAMTRFLKRTL